MHDAGTPAHMSAATICALGSATLIIAHQVAGKATRDALFLSQFEVTELPKIVLFSALVSMLAVVLMSRLLLSYGPQRVMPLAFAVSAMLFVLDWVLYAKQPHEVAMLLYVQMAIFGAVLISGFWSVVNERFDPHTAKQTIARVAAAATLGGVVGGVIASKVAHAIDVRAMLLVLAGLHLGCVFSVKAIGESRRSVPIATPPEMSSGMQLLLTNRYLQLMGILMVLAAVLAALLDYAFKSQASIRYASGEELVAFFGKFYAAAGLVTFIVQSVLGPRVLKRFGIGATLAVMPAVAVTAGLLGAAAGRLWATVLLRGAQMVFANSFFRSAFELLYTPLPPLTKRPTKTIIDVASDRLGDVLGSGLLLGLLALSPTLPVSAVIVLSILVATAALVVVARLYRGYIEQLASSLRDGAISLSDDEVLDATTRHTLAEVSVATEREQLMSRIKQMKYARAGGEADVDNDSMIAAPDGSAIGEVALAGPLTHAITALLCGDLPRIRRFLAGNFMDPRLTPYLLPLLGNDAVAEDVRMELRWMAPQIIGTLSDALINPDLPLAARQRVPSVLEVTHNPRAVAGLMLGLDDDEFNIRYSCARALARMLARDPYMRIDPERVFDAVKRELKVDTASASTRNLHFEIDLPVDLAAGGAHDAASMTCSMEHVFTLLSLALDRDALQLSLHAVFSQDRNLRGTALEYLENVLPEEVRYGLWPHLGESNVAARSNRSRSDLLADLKRGVDRS